jgi:MFS family permease
VFDLLHRNRDLRMLFFAQVVSFMGDWFADVALLGLVLDLTDSDSAAALVLVSSMLPSFLVSPLAGAAADRLDRRRLIVWVSIAQAVAALALLGVHEGTVWLAFVARALVAALAAFVAPASQAAIPNLVEPEDLGTANALLGSVWGAMLAIGAAVGGAFTVAFGRSASFVADAATFLAAAAFISLIRRPLSTPHDHAAGPPPPIRPVKDMVDAVHYARARREVLLLLMSKCGVGLAGGVVGLLAVYAKHEFHAGDGGIGLLLAARGVGALVGPIIARKRLSADVSGVLVACGTAGLIYGLGYLIVATSPSMAPAARGERLPHHGGGAQWTMSNFGLQLVTADEYRGRVFAGDFALVTLTMSASFVFAGVASSAFGPRIVTVVLALIAATWSVVYLSLTRSLRRSLSER